MSVTVAELAARMEKMAGDLQEERQKRCEQDERVGTLETTVREHEAGEALLPLQTRIYKSQLRWCRKAARKYFAILEAIRCCPGGPLGQRESSTLNLPRGGPYEDLCIFVVDLEQAVGSLKPRAAQEAIRLRLFEGRSAPQALQRLMEKGVRLSKPKAQAMFERAIEDLYQALTDYRD